MTGFVLEKIEQVILIDPYYGGSHRYFLDQLSVGLQDLGIQVDRVVLPSRHWRQRLQLSHLELAEKTHDLLQRKEPDPAKTFFLTCSLMDSMAFRWLLPKKYHNSPFQCYFHENQMSYPLNKNSPKYERDRDIQKHILPAFHLNQILSADKVIFNSHYTKQNTFQKLEEFLKGRSEPVSLSLLNQKKEDSLIIPVGIPFTSTPIQWREREKKILWNHRWEYDKNTKDFSQLMNHLWQKDLEIKLALMGEFHRQDHPDFSPLIERYSERIIPQGKVENHKDYLKEVSLCRVLPVTSIHDFLGLSVLEAISQGVIPLLPNRLAYPELIPEVLQPLLLYPESTSLTKLSEMTLNLLERGLTLNESELLMSHTQKFSFSSALDHWKLNLLNQ